MKENKPWSGGQQILTVTRKYAFPLLRDLGTREMYRITPHGTCFSLFSVSGRHFSLLGVLITWLPNRVRGEPQMQGKVLSKCLIT
jgi:hypothetical protein